MYTWTQKSHVYEFTLIKYIYTTSIKNVHVTVICNGKIRKKCQAIEGWLSEFLQSSHRRKVMKHNDVAGS